jgi:hypothetical protein
VGYIEEAITSDISGIYNCINTGNIDGTFYVAGIVAGHIVGGIVGSIKGNIEILNCINIGNIKGRDGVSGIVGTGGGSQTDTAYITNCINAGYVVVTVGTVGGIFGYGSQVNITNCINTGVVEASTIVGTGGAIVA